jgi:hypothetical protein
MRVGVARRRHRTASLFLLWMLYDCDACDRLIVDECVGVACHRHHLYMFGCYCQTNPKLKYELKRMLCIIYF